MYKVYVVLEVCPMEDGFNYRTWTFSDIDVAREFLVKVYLSEYGSEHDDSDKIMSHVQTYNEYGGFYLFENSVLDSFEIFNAWS